MAEPMRTQNDFWTELFATPTQPADSVHVEMRLLRRHGRPLLLLPGQARMAPACLSLYPAQTAVARTAKALLRWMLKASLPVGAEKISIFISPQDPFVKFLASLAGARSEKVPGFGILAGNPASDGQRFLLLVFDAHQNPVAIAKAGVSAPARVLIEQEQSFLGSVPGGIRGIPKLGATFDSPRARALALNFFPGHPPRPHQHSAIPGLLTSWLHLKKNIPMSEMPDWKRLESVSAADGLFRAVARPLRERAVHPAIHHGDFAPWNIKVSPEGGWTVLDWERAELEGVAGWDWFHYVIQTGILVEHPSIPDLVERVEGLLRSPAFKQYATLAAIVGLERELVLAYLLHMVGVIKPSEGLAQTRELLNALALRWSFAGA